jgi:hypothetical protein
MMRRAVVVMIVGSGFVRVSGSGGTGNGGMRVVGRCFGHRAAAQRRHHQH